MSTNNPLPVTNITEHSSCNQSLETTFIALNITIGAMTLFGNLLVFVTIVTSRDLRQHPMNQFLASLAVTDIIMGACVAPGYSLFCTGCFKYPLSKYCWLFQGPTDIALASSICNLLAISCDRCLSVYWPLRYPTLMTRRRIIFILSLTWGFSFIVYGIRHFWMHTKTGAELHAITSLYYNLRTIFVLLIPCIIITVINVKIILTIRKQARQDIVLRSPHAQDEADIPDENQAVVTRKRKGTLACALVVMVFVVFWIPRVGFHIQYMIKGELREVNTLLQKISMFFFILQSSVNPLIYSFYRADFRKAVVNILRCNNNSDTRVL